MEDNLELYRGIGELEFNYLKENNKFNQFLSTSFSDEFTNDFLKENEATKGKGYKVVIRAPKGTNGLYINGKGAYSNENEFIINVGQKYKIIEIKENILHLEVILDE